MNKKHKTVLKTIDMKTLDNVSLYECTSYFQQKQFIVLAKQSGKNIFENCVLILCWTLSAKKKIKKKKHFLETWAHDNMKLVKILS